jgi:hypothetical protein
MKVYGKMKMVCGCSVLSSASTMVSLGEPYLTKSLTIVPNRQRMKLIVITGQNIVLAFSV